MRDFADTAKGKKVKDKGGKKKKIDNQSKTEEQVPNQDPETLEELDAKTVADAKEKLKARF